MASTETETETTSSSDSYTMPPSLQALMNAAAAAADDDHTPRAAGHTRRRRTSEFAIYRDANTKPAQPATSPGTQLHRERRMRERELRALEEEYLAGSSSKGKGRASVVTDEDGTEDAPRRAAATNPSASSILSHGHPDPALAPMPAPPLSRLHRRFATGTTPSPPRRPSKLSPTPAPAPAPADPDVSLLQHMRRLRAHYEALHPPAPPSPKPTRPKPARPKPQHPSPPPPSASHKPTATTADLLAQYTFTLAHLPALTHHSRTATLTLTPPSPPSPGHLTLNLRPAPTSPTSPTRGGSQNTYTIPPHGLPITIATAATATATTTHTYPLADLPLQHLPAIRYATRFVAAVQRATVVSRLEIRDRACALWAATRWADGRFEAVRSPPKDPAAAAAAAEEEELRVRIDGARVRVWAGGRRVRDVTAPRWAPAVDRARSLSSACWRALGEDDGAGAGGAPASTAAAPAVLAGGAQARGRCVPFPIDAGTAYVPAVGWCRRDAHTGWWGMLFVDGVRLDVDPRSGDAVWVDGGGGGGAARRRVLVGGMGLREVRERVGRFVERGL